MVKRICTVSALAMFALAVLISLLPASVGRAGVSFGCNPSTIVQVENIPTTGADTSYLPAIFVWLNSGSVTPRSENAVTAASDQAVCRSAAQNQMIPALVLAGLGLLLLLFGAQVIDYVRTGERPERQPGAPSRFRTPDWSAWHAGPGQRMAPGHFDPTVDTAVGGQSSTASGPPSTARRAAQQRSVVRLTCQHLEEMIGDPSDMVGRVMLCRTCGMQTVEAVVS
jgi:hypothetical protein